MNMTQISGQAMGIIAVLLGFVCFQMRTHKKLLILQMMTIIAFCIHYYLIGAASGLVMNLIAIVRNLVYCFRDKKAFSGKWIPVFFAVVMAVCGLLSWQGLPTVFVVAGVSIHTLCLSMDDPQKIRKSMLITCPMVLLYNILVFSIGGAVYESVVIVSSLIGIVRYGKGAKK